MEFSTYFRPLGVDIAQKKYILDNYKVCDFTKIHTVHFPNWREADIVIIGLDEDRGAKEAKGGNMAADLIRKYFYQLNSPKREIRLADLGNLQKRERMSNYMDDVADVVREIVQAGKVLILIGGTQDLTYGQYMGYGKVTAQAEYVCIDSELDLEDSDFGINNHSYNHKILLHSPNYLYNFTNLGHQTYFTSIADKKRMQNLNFAAIRLGNIRANLREAEPYLRLADLVSFDLSAIRASDAPGVTHPCPAGFTAEEACQLVRYAGMSNRVSSLLISEVNPMKDLNGQTSLLAAMMLWYFVEGFYNRKVDDLNDLSSMQKHTISLQGGAQEIVFYYNPKTDRWWMEVPYMEDLGKEHPRTEMVPCAESDFMQAQQDDIPEKWWLAHHKLRG
jgi:formiminoglutamase